MPSRAKLISSPAEVNMHMRIGIDPTLQSLKTQSALNESCEEFGKFEFRKVPFGLAQAPAQFQQLINDVLNVLPFGFE